MIGYMLKTALGPIWHSICWHLSKSEKPSIISQLLHSKSLEKAPFWHSGLSYIMHLVKSEKQQLISQLFNTKTCEKGTYM